MITFAQNKHYKFWRETRKKRRKEKERHLDTKQSLDRDRLERFSSTLSIKAGFFFQKRLIKNKKRCGGGKKCQKLRSTSIYTFPKMFFFFFLFLFSSFF